MKQFQKVQVQRPTKSAFDLSHERKTTLNMGQLVPVLCHEILPGDTIKMDFESFLRTMPLISPVMHRVNFYAHAFFVPNRLLLKRGVWEDFITQAQGAPAALPSFTETCFAAGATYAPVSGDLLDHLGYGVKYGNNANNAKMSQMPIRAYHKIWNDYYRDQNFQAVLEVSDWPDSWTSASAGNPTYFSLRKRAWEKDYFTAALPTQQRGATVTMPLGTVAPVKGTFMRTNNSGDTVTLLKIPGKTNANGALSGTGGVLIDSTPSNLTIGGGLEADLSTATSASISALRQAFALQRWYEASMRFGARYVEQLLGLFGVVSKDARLQRAEFLAGGKLPVQIGEVLQTSASVAGQTVQGNMAGRGISAGSVFRMNRTFDEHGFLMVIVSVLPRTSYTNVALRQNFKLDTFDFAFPQLAHLSEQPVYNGEIYNSGNDATARTAWGYQPIYSEYRYIPDTVHGDFRSTLGYWSLARDFSSLPALGTTFVQCSPRTDIFPVDFANQQLLLQSYAKITAIRPLPKFGTPI